MPLVDVTFDGTISAQALRQLGEFLPDIIAEAVDCPEEPWIDPPKIGDIEVRFHPRHDRDVGDLNVVIEVRTKLFASRLDDKQRRVDLIRGRLAHLLLGRVGVWLILAEGAWAQSNDPD
jgi:hypothetical protein